MKQPIILLTICLSVFIACKTEQNSTTQQEEQTTKDAPQTTVISEKYGCSSEIAECVDIRVSYPTLQKLGEVDRETVHHYIHDYLADFLITDKPIESKELKPYIKESAAAIIESAKQSGGNNYEFDSSFEKTFKNQALFCLKNRYTLKDGMEETLSGESYTIFDLRVNDIAPLEKLVANEQGLNQFLLAEIKEKDGIIGEEDISAHGYYISDKDFAVTNNIGITDKSIIFAYSPSEIAPEEKGIIKIEKPKAEVLPYLHKDFVQKWENAQ